MYSMTGYGKGTAEKDGKSVVVELKTVNHRFLDCNFKLPRTFLFIEDSIKKLISSNLSRGHVELYLTYEQKGVTDGVFDVDLNVANNYLAAAKKLAENTGLDNDITLSALLKVPDVVIKNQPNEDEELLGSLTMQALKEALDNLKAMRAKEGLSQKADISSKLDNIQASLDKIILFAPLVVEDYRKQLNARIFEVVEPTLVDKQRLATEVALYADRCAIDEEITRLGTHIVNMRALLESEEPVGRKMDFLVQEFNRETNTIGSKANDMRITTEVLAIKNEIEKMREQAANIE